jgi:hypothetical protein
MLFSRSRQWLQWKTKSSTKDRKSSFQPTLETLENRWLPSSSGIGLVPDAPVGSNPPPIVTNPGPQSNNEGDAVSLPIQASDADGDTLSYYVIGLPPGVSINPTTGLIWGTIDPRGGRNTPYQTTVGVGDGHHPVVRVSFLWTVHDTTAPSVSPIADQVNNEGDPVSVQVQAVDGQLYGVYGLPNGVTINHQTGLISGTIDSRAAGDYGVRVRVYDNPYSQQNFSDVFFNWTIGDTTAPSLTVPGDQFNNEGDAVSGVAVSASDADSLTISGLPTGLSADSQGNITGTIDPRAAGSYTVTVSTTDDGVTTNSTFNWTVADSAAPGLILPPTQINNEGDVVSGVSVTAADADSLTITGLPPGLSADASGNITGSIDPRGAGIYTVEVSSTDNGVTTSGSFFWGVHDTTPPELTSPGDQTNNEGDLVSLQISGLDVHHFFATGLPAGLHINGATGLISGTIAHRAAGQYAVTVQANDETAAPSTISFNWTVGDTTSAAVFSPGPQGSFVGDAVSVQITSKDADSFDASNLPPGLSIDTNTGLITGQATTAGIFTVTVTATDAGSGSAITTFRWTVLPAGRDQHTGQGGLAAVLGDDDGSADILASTGFNHHHKRI